MTLLRLLLFLLSAFTSITESVVLVGNDDIPWFKDTDSVEVYHLRSFSLPLVETATGIFSIRTSGLALRSSATHEVITFEYRPLNYSSCFLPVVAINGDGSYKVVWDKRADVDFSVGIDANYWEHSTYLATMNGVVYKDYIRWIENYVQQNDKFFPQSICQNASLEALPCYVSAFTAETFLSESFLKFASMGVSLHAIIAPRASEIRFIAEEQPIVINATTVASTEVAAMATVATAHGYTAATPAAAGDESTELDGKTYQQIQLRGSSQKSIALETAQEVATDPAATTSLHSLKKEKHKHHSKEELPSQRIAVYYLAIIECMREYNQGDFVDALSSCLPSSTTSPATTSTYGASDTAVAVAKKQEEEEEGVAFVHMDADSYYQIIPRYPYAYSYNYPQVMPPPIYSPAWGTNVEDVGIMGILALFGLVGLIMVLIRMQVFEGCSKKLSHLSQHGIKRMVRRAPPSKGGYSPGASELPDVAQLRRNTSISFAAENHSMNSPPNGNIIVDKPKTVIAGKGAAATVVSRKAGIDDDNAGGARSGSRGFLSAVTPGLLRSSQKYASLSTKEDVESALPPFRNPFQHNNKDPENNPHQKSSRSTTHDSADAATTTGLKSTTTTNAPTAAAAENGSGGELAAAGLEIELQNKKPPSEMMQLNVIHSQPIPRLQPPPKATENSQDSPTTATSTRTSAAVITSDSATAATAATTVAVNGHTHASSHCSEKDDATHIAVTSATDAACSTSRSADATPVLKSVSVLSEQDQNLICFTPTETEHDRSPHVFNNELQLQQQLQVGVAHQMHQHPQHQQQHQPPQHTLPQSVQQTHNGIGEHNGSISINNSNNNNNNHSSKNNSDSSGVSTGSSSSSSGGGSSMLRMPATTASSYPNDYPLATTSSAPTLVTESWRNPSSNSPSLNNPTSLPAPQMRGEPMLQNGSQSIPTTATTPAAFSTEATRSLNRTASGGSGGWWFGWQ